MSVFQGTSALAQGSFSSQVTWKEQLKEASAGFWLCGQPLPLVLSRSLTNCALAQLEGVCQLASMT